MNVKGRSSSPRHALSIGQSALAAKDFAAAAQWLSRASRLAPEDNAVKMLLASALIRDNPDKARALLTAIVAAHPSAWTAKRILWRLHSPTDDSFIALLADILSRSALLNSDTSLFGSWSHATELSGFPGWVGLYPDGRLRLSAQAEVRLDQRSVKLPRNSGNGGWIIQLPGDWWRARSLTVEKNGRPFLGSPVAIEAHTTIEGFAELAPNGNLQGWAWMPAAPDTPAELIVATEGKPSKRFTVTADDETYTPTASNGIDRPRGFLVKSEQLANSFSIRVLSKNGKALFGSPMRTRDQRRDNARAAQRLASVMSAGWPNKQSKPRVTEDRWRPLPALLADWCDTRIVQPERAGVDVIIPVFKGCADFLACLAGVQASIHPNTRVVVVDDCSPDPELREAIQASTKSGVIALRHDRNFGFPAAVNTGLRHAATAPGGPRDVVLLNSDTLVPYHWIEQLSQAAYSAPNIGTVSPFTNDGTIVSYPLPGKPAPVADQLETNRLNTMMALANRGLVVDLPTAVGFCMFIRHDCLIATGMFREDAFAQGYGEENDFCLRARHLGWRHVADTSTFVAHAGGRSFGTVKVDLIRRNTVILNELHPGYNRIVEEFNTTDPLRSAREHVDQARWADGRYRDGAVILVTHANGGGVARHVQERACSIRALGLRPIILRPATALPEGESASSRCEIGDETPTTYPNLGFDPETHLGDLVRFLKPEIPRWIEYHHLLDHSPAITALPPALGIPYDVILHDFALVCPRITFCGTRRAYCGEPLEIDACETCVADNGNRLNQDIGPAALRIKSGELLTGARQVIAPTVDTSRRIGRYVPLPKVVVRGWQDDSMLLRHFKRKKGLSVSENIKVAVVGAIGEEKGFDVLLGCARDAAKRSLAISFVVIGHTVDDDRLIDTGTVFITGKYEEEELLKLIAAEHVEVGFLPSVCPETWSYALSSMWLANLWPVAFDLGGHAERISRSGYGSLLPLGLPVSRINDFLQEISKRGRC